MKRSLSIILAGFLIFLNLHADDDHGTVFDFEDYGGESIDTHADSKSPFSFTIQADNIATTEINRGCYKGDDFRFATAEAELGMVFYYNKTYKEAANISLDYTATTIDWHENAWFDQKHFNVLSLSLAGMTQRIHKWLWRGQFNFNIDANEISAGFTYATYDLLLWGKYEYCKNVGVHVGLIVETGMSTDRVYPILGVNWNISKAWHLNLVFPVNVGIEYHLKNWVFALQGRNFSFRDRVGRHEASARSVVRYQNLGAEFAVKYAKNAFDGNLHAGYTLGGRFRVADEYNHHPRTYHLDPSGYVGGELSYHF